MILYFDSFITDVPLNKHFIDPNKWVRESCPAYAMPSKVDIAKYTLASYATYPWSHVLVRYTLADTSRNEEFETYITSLFPNAIIVRGNSANQTEYRKSLAIMEEWDDEWIWYAPNNDHPIMTHDLSIIETALQKARSFAAHHPYITIPYSHFSEYINLTKVGNPFFNLFGKDTSIIDEDEDTISCIRLHGDNTGVQIVNKKTFAYWFDSHELGDATVYRSEDVRQFFLIKNQLLVIPKREIAAHFDGYSHTVRGLAEIAADQVPPLMIPEGFFDKKMKIKYGFTDYDPAYTNINPLARDYSFENIRTGTDLKLTKTRFPVFWKNHTAELLEHPHLDEQHIERAQARNEEIIASPYALRNKKMNTATAAYIIRHLRNEKIPHLVSLLRKKKNGISRKLSRVCGLHPASHPYLSGDTFRSFAKHILDMDSSITINNIAKDDIIFVQSPRLHEFITTIHPQIHVPYVLITHNGDENIDATYLPFIESAQLVRWFAQNACIHHPKVIPLPIGLENKWYHLHGIPSYFDSLRTLTPKKKNHILYKFSVSTNPTERGAALAALDAHPNATTFIDWRDSYAYLSTLQAHAFVASPPGNGEDCIRTWEAMYLGAVPIVKRSPLTEHFVSLDLPIVLIDDWKELAGFTNKTLESIYATMVDKFNNPALWSNYWKELIHKKYD